MEQRLRVFCPWRIYALCAHYGIFHLIKALRLVKRFSVQIHVPRMKNVSFRRNEPVSAQNFLIRVIVPKHAVRYYRLPDPALNVFPVVNPLGAFDDHLFPLSRPIGDTAKLAAASVFRLHPFPVFPAVHRYNVPRRRDIRRPLDCRKRPSHTSVIPIVSGDGYMIFSSHGIPPLPFLFPV